MKKWKSIDIGEYFNIYFKLEGFRPEKKKESFTIEESVTIFEKLHQDFRSEFFEHEIENYEEFRKYHKQFWNLNDALEIPKS